MSKNLLTSAVPTYKTPEEVNCKAAQAVEMQNAKVVVK